MPALAYPRHHHPAGAFHQQLHRVNEIIAQALAGGQQGSRFFLQHALAHG
jgi:hypothetical protein